ARAWSPLQSGALRANLLRIAKLRVKTTLENLYMTSQDERLNALKQKYQAVLSTIQQQQVRLEHLHVQDNKLFIGGAAPSTEAKNKVWDEIKKVDPTYSDLTADIRVEQQARTQAAGATPGGGQQQFQTYTVQPGDTLSKISV